MPVLFERDDEKILFIHIPKCGGNSVLELFHKNGWAIKESRKLTSNMIRHGHMPYEHWKKIPVFVEPNYKFALVRDPLDRIISHCEMWMKYICDTELKNMMEMTIKIHDSKHCDPAALEKISNFCSPLTEIFMGERDVLMKFLNRPESLGSAVEELFTHLRSHDAETVMNLQRYLSFSTVDNYLNISLQDMHLEEVLSMYLDEYRAKIGDIGTNPTPAYLHVSPDTEIHKLENFSTLLESLYDRKVINEVSFKRGFPHINASRFSGLLSDKPRNFSKDSDFRKEFLTLYQKDYEIFDYELNI